MKKRRRILVLVALAVFVVAVAVCVSRPREPVYQGKRLSAWLENLDSGYFLESEKARRAKSAIHEMGTNALPFLVRELRVKDSRLKRRMLKLTPKPLIGHLPASVFAHVRRQRAVAGFRALGPLGRPAMPELSELLNDKDVSSYAARAMVQMGSEAVPPLVCALTNREPAVRYAAAGGLYWLKADAVDAVPALLAALRDEKEFVRAEAAMALGSIRQHAETVVPALLALLQDPSSSVRHQSVSAIGRFGAEAKPAVPALLKTAREDADRQVRNSAVDAIHDVDPETAVKSGLMDPETVATTKRLEEAISVLMENMKKQ